MDGDCNQGEIIRTLTVSLIGAAALATGLVLLRQHKRVETDALVKSVPPGEEVPAEIHLDRLRQLGI